MSLTRLSTKGQLVMPKTMRERHGWQAGTQLELVDLGHAVVVRLPKPFAQTRLLDGFGLLHGNTGPVGIDAQDAAVDAMVSAGWQPGPSGRR